VSATYPATATLTRFAQSLRVEDLPAGVVARAKDLVLDTLGVALAAVPDTLGQTITQHVRGFAAAPEATVVGSTWKTAASLAALANGTLASGLDYDAGFHLTTHVVPASVAAGERVGARGARVLEGIVVGYEVGARLTEALDSSRGSGGGVSDRGWYHVGLIGPIASALAAGLILDLDETPLRHAVGIAAATSGGVRRNFGTMAKAFQAGNAACQGVQAALLAEQGFTADPDILEAPLGLFGALGTAGDEGIENALAKLGSTFELLSSLRIKRFPACTPAHRPVQALLALRREHAFAAEDIACIEADLHTFSLLRLDPHDPVEAGFSLPFLAAAAVVDGDLSLTQLDEAHLVDPRIRALMARVRPLADSTPSGRDEEAEVVRVHLHDGTTLEREMSRVDRLESRAEIQEKFVTCAARVLPSGQADRVYEHALRLDELATLEPLMSATRPSEP
jgi:2-methylcitrate dehydratase PrpD